MKFRIAALVLIGFFHAAAMLAGNQPSDERLNITEQWSIRIPASPHRALVRAAGDLQAFLLERHNLKLKITEETKGRGIVLAVEEQKKDDRFSLRAVSSRDQLIVSGSSPRSVYQGVLLLEDRLAVQPAVSSSLDETILFPFRERYVIWDCLLTGQNKGAIGFDLESHVREAVRLGYTGMECNRFVGMTLVQQGDPRDPYPWYTYWGPSMDQFVSSPLFEGVFPKDYLDRNLADLKHVVKVVESFGLKPIFMGYEPRYVPEEFLQRHPELRGPRVDHPLRSIAARYSLCPDRPEVLEHYRALARRLAEEVPGIKEMHIIISDSGAGLCWSKVLYAGRNGPAHCKEIPMGERMRKFFMAIRQGFKDAGIDVEIVIQPHKTNRGEIDAFFNNVPGDIGFTAGNWSSWSLSFHDPLGVDRYVLSRLRETGRRALYYQQHFFGFDGAPTSEFPLPYYLAQRLKRAVELDLDALNTLGGFVSPPIKEQSVMQEVYRHFLLEPGTPVEALVEKVGYGLGGREGGALLVAIWKDIHAAFVKNGRHIGFGLGTEYTSRRTLVRPLVSDAPALLPEERDWWLAYTFGGSLRFGHAHLFRSERGIPPEEWYITNHERAARARDAFQNAALKLGNFLQEHQVVAGTHPYLAAHERQLRFLGHVYATGANLYEGQRILDKYSSKNTYDGLKQEVDSDLVRFQAIVESEIDNTGALLKLVEEGGEIGMVLLPEETTWAYSTNLPELLRQKIEIMRRHLPETEEVLRRWFNSEY